MLHSGNISAACFSSLNTTSWRALHVGTQHSTGCRWKALSLRKLPPSSQWESNTMKVTYHLPPRALHTIQVLPAYIANVFLSHCRPMHLSPCLPPSSSSLKEDRDRSWATPPVSKGHISPGISSASVIGRHSWRRKNPRPLISWKSICSKTYLAGMLVLYHKWSWWFIKVLGKSLCICEAFPFLLFFELGLITFCCYYYYPVSFLCLVFLIVFNFPI